MASRVTTQSGLWSDPSTWGGQAPPGDGDTATVNHAVTLDGVVTLGTSVTGNVALTIRADLTIADGAMLVLHGSVLQGLGTTTTGLGAGWIRFDATTAAGSSRYIWTIGDGNADVSMSNAARFVIRGTSERRFRIESALGGMPGYFTHGGYLGGGCFDAAYADLVRLGDATTMAISTAADYRAIVFRLDHVVLEATGSVGPATLTTRQPKAPTGDSTVRVTNTVVARAAAAYPIDFALGTRTTGLWEVRDNDFGSYVRLKSNYTISGNVHRSVWYLDGILQQATPGPYAATGITLDGPQSGLPDEVSSPFTVTLAGGTAVSSPVTVTPDDGGAGGTFSPSSVVLTEASPSATFTYTPAGIGTRLIWASNDGTMPRGNGTPLRTDPRTYISSTAAALYFLTPPPGALGTLGHLQGEFTVAIPERTTLSPPVTITPSDGGDGGTFDPPSVILSTETPRATFTYEPASKGTKTIRASNDGGLIDPAPVSYTVRRSFDEALAAWENRMLAASPSQVGGRKYYDRYKPPASLGQLAGDNHYDPLAVYWNVRMYTDDPSWDDVVDAARYQIRDLYLIPYAWLIQAPYMHTKGALTDYLHTGSARSRDAICLLSRNTFARDSVSLTTLEYWAKSRETALSLLCILDAEAVGMAHRTRVEELRTVALGHIDQWSDPNYTATDWHPECLAVHCFMVGLTMRSLIAYWDRYRDPAIPPKIKQMLDWLWDHAWDRPAMAFPYWDRDTDPIAAIPVCQRTPTGGTLEYDGGSQPKPAPDLNPLIGPAYAWYATIATDPSERRLYIERYEDVMIGSKASGGVNGTDQVGTQKVYNQAHFWEHQGLSWRSQSLSPWTGATAYTLEAPAPASGEANVLSAPFTVQLSGSRTSVSAPVIITPSDGGAGGTFVPSRSVLTTDSPKAMFRYAPPASADGQTVTISVSSEGVLADPPSVSYQVSGVATFATGFRLIPPASASGPDDWSDDWTLILDPPNSVPPRSLDAVGGMVVISVSLAGTTTGARFPAVTYLSVEQRTTTFRIKPGVATPVDVVVGNGDGFPVPPRVTYTAAPPATMVALSGPVSGRVGEPSTFVVTPNGAFTGTITVQDDGQGGTITPGVLSWAGTSGPQSFTYTAQSPGTRRLTLTNSAGLQDPPPLLYDVEAPPSSRVRPLRYVPRPPARSARAPGRALRGRPKPL